MVTTRDRALRRHATPGGRSRIAQVRGIVGDVDPWEERMAGSRASCELGLDDPLATRSICG
jgi:hypothetical protein